MSDSNDLSFEAILGSAEDSLSLIRRGQTPSSEEIENISRALETLKSMREIEYQSAQAAVLAVIPLVVIDTTYKNFKNFPSPDLSDNIKETISSVNEWVTKRNSYPYVTKKGG